MISLSLPGHGRAEAPQRAAVITAPRGRRHGLLPLALKFINYHLFQPSSRHHPRPRAQFVADSPLVSGYLKLLHCNVPVHRSSPIALCLMEVLRVSGVALLVTAGPPGS